MRKTLLVAAAGLALSVAAPLAASAAPVSNADIIRAAAERMSPVESTAWHCRPWSAWCRGYVRPHPRRHRHRRHRW